MDRTRAKTDRKLRQMERRIRKIYKQSEHEIAKNWNSFMEIQGLRVKSLQDEYYRLKNAGRTDEAKRVAIELSKQKKDITLNSEHYQRVVRQTASEISRVNSVVISYVDEQMPEIYRINYNDVASNDRAKIAIALGIISFRVLTRDAMKDIVEKKPKTVPQKTLNIPKDIRWNTKKINSSVLRGIMQGERIDEIAKRLMPIVDYNSKAAVRAARTLCTSVENKARLDSFKELEDDGAVMKKVWIATGDERTRDWHLDMDGQEVDLDEDFTDGLGNKLAYPGDMSAPGETVYNCRCSMESKIIGFRKADGRVEYINRTERTSAHSSEIDRERTRRQYG